jgi:acyl dehydratase
MTEISFDELPGLAGRDLGCSDWLPIDQDRIDRFADATDDHQWIHVDEARAGRENGGTIAHGLLTFAMLPKMAQELLRVTDASKILNCGCNRLRFATPVPVGARIRLRQSVRNVAPRAGGYQVVADGVIELEGAAKPACVVETVMLVLP